MAEPGVHCGSAAPASQVGDRQRGQTQVLEILGLTPVLPASWCL